jgi:membrane protease YdiL (CAAX protease family)
MKKIILEVLSFIKNPDDQRIENWSLKTNIKYIFYILFFEFILNMVVINAIIYVINKIEPIVTNTRIIYEDNKLLPMLIAASLWAPLIEEVIFRLGLRYNKFYSVFINRKRWDFIFRFLVYFTVLADRKSVV